MTAPPIRARLVPEFLVDDLTASLAFWRDLLGFRVLYDRPEDGFAYLGLEGSEVMLEQQGEIARQWRTDVMERPFGRGVNFQIEVANVQDQLARLKAGAWPLYMDLEEKWYRVGDSESGVRQFLVQDPDGYLVRLCTSIGDRPGAKPIATS